MSEVRHKLATHQVLDWLKEREANARAIAARKAGSDRDGWLEDAEYFKAAAAKVWEHAATPDLIKSLRDVIAWVPGAEHWHTSAAQEAVNRARAAIAKVEGATP